MPRVARTLATKGLRPLLSARTTRGATVDAARASEVAKAVDAGLAVVPLAPTCLRRSVVLQRELDRLDLASSLHIGLRRGAAGPEAHAWVQVGDAVVNDDPAVTSTYAQLAASKELEQLLPLLT